MKAGRIIRSSEMSWRIRREVRLCRVVSWVVRREGVSGVMRRRVERVEARALISEWSVSIMVEKVGGCWGWGEGGGWGLEGMDFVWRGLVGGWWGWVDIGRKGMCERERGVGGFGGR